MKIVDSRLYLEFDEMVECGVSGNYLSKAKSAGTGCWTFINDPADKRRVLVDYEDLRPVYKKMVLDRFGNPWEHVAREPILAMVVNDFAAESYFKSYRYQNLTLATGECEKYLPIDTVNKYTRAAGWLNLIIQVVHDGDIVKKSIGLQIKDFYKHVQALICIEKERGKLEGYAGIDVLPGDFPSSYQRLMAKAKKYDAEGYDAIVAPEFGNKQAAKIGKVVSESSLLLPAGGHDNGEMLPEMSPKSANKVGAFDPELYSRQMAVIRAIAEKHNNFDAKQVRDFAKTIFDAAGWEMVSVERVRQIMNENKMLLTAGRRGKRVHDSTVARQIKRKVTEMPMVYWTMDGWTVELMYQEQGSKGVDYKRMVAVIVLDAWTKYPVGYATGERETPELIREALRSSLLHTKELFGEVYRPGQLQSDNYQIKNLTPFYSAVANMHIPAAVGNAKAKVIEPYFKDLNKNYCQKLPNWTGFNVNASKKNQVNSEFTNKIKHSFPDKDGVMQQIALIIARERAAKRERYVSKWPDLPADRRYRMDELQWLEIFGVPVGKTNRLTGEGIVKQIEGQKYCWDSLDLEFRKQMHVDWQIVADLTNMSKVLAVSPDGTKKYILEQTRVVPMDIMSSTEEDHTYRAMVNGYNKNLTQYITNQYGQDADIAREVVNSLPLDMTDPEELNLKLMLTIGGQQKERIQDAKRLGGPKENRKAIAAAAKSERERADEWEDMQDRRAEDIVDFSVYK